MLLSSITNQLACVTYPKIDSSILEKIQIIQLSSIKILVVITVKAGIIKTITLEMNTELDSSKIQDIEQVLNEKLCGLSFSEIKTTFKDRFANLPGEQQPIIRFFLDSVDKIFKDFPQNEKIFISGAKNVIKQPEFETPEKFQSVIELIEDKNIIVHILEKSNESKSDNVSVSIGSEIDFDKLSEYSLISKEYKMGDVSGSLAIIGPKRMEYDKVVAIVDYVAKMLTEVLKN